MPYEEDEDDEEAPKRRASIALDNGAAAHGELALLDGTLHELPEEIDEAMAELAMLEDEMPPPLGVTRGRQMSDVI